MTDDTGSRQLTLPSASCLPCWTCEFQRWSKVLAAVGKVSIRSRWAWKNADIRSLGEEGTTMPFSGNIDQQSSHSVTLADIETKSIERVASDLVAAAGLVNSHEWTEAATEAWHDVPVAVRKRVARFRRHSGPAGALLVRGLPVDEVLVPDTPKVSGSTQSEPTIPAALNSLFASGLGDPAAYIAEKSGALVQDVVPVPGNEDFQGNEGSVLLSFHNENAFHPHRPDYVLLLCLRSDHDRVAGLRVACIRQAYPHLSDRCREALFREDFVTAAPPSFGNGANAVDEPHAVLTGAPDDPDIVVDFAATTPLSSAAGDAMLELQSALAEHAVTLRLVPGDLAIVDNRVALHGRTAFTPRYDGRDRWLQRTFAMRDLRRSRASRPADGHVLVD
jgi:L-asparagine oxygenase